MIKRAAMVMLSVFFLMPITAFAQIENSADDFVDEYLRARVVRFDDESRDVGGFEEMYRVITLDVLKGSDAGKQVKVDTLKDDVLQQSRVEIGQKVVLLKTFQSIFNEETERLDDSFIYFIVDPYRLPALWGVAALFMLVVFIFARKQGLFALFGLMATVIILTRLTVPLIMNGYDPLWVSFGSALLIAVIAILIAHGGKTRTYLALFATVATLFLALGISWVFVTLAGLSGFGTEEAIFLQSDMFPRISLRGLLLGGIIIGALGVLDDVTTAQTATIEELHKANEALNMKELYVRGLSVGKEHIVSLVNTLFMAYAGASFPLFFLFALSGSQPLWVTLNTEFIAEEVVRMLVGSTVLVLAVPIATLCASYWFGKRRL